MFLTNEIIDLVRAEARPNVSRRHAAKVMDKVYRRFMKEYEKILDSISDDAEVGKCDYINFPSKDPENVLKSIHAHIRMILLTMYNHCVRVLDREGNNILVMDRLGEYMDKWFVDQLQWMIAELESNDDK